MLKINKLTAENFRGIRLPFTIDFTKGGRHTSALVYGKNGTGKSSIVDAWEWLNTSQIQALSREGVSANDFPHRLSKGGISYVSADFNNGTINNVTATFNEKKITTPTITGQYSDFKKLSLYPNYLRYSDLQDFVFKTKAERYKYIAKFFGLEKFSALQDSLQTALNKQFQQLQGYKATLEKNERELTTIIGTTTINETAVVTYINSVGSKHTIPAITTIAQGITVRDGLQKIVTQNPVAKELTEWQGFQKRIQQLYPLTSITQTVSELETAFVDLKKDEEAIKQLVLSEIYESTMKVLPLLEDVKSCPICDAPFEGDLLLHLQKKHELLGVIHEKKKAYEQKKTLVQRYLEMLSKRITGILAEHSQNILDANKNLFADILLLNNSIPAVQAELQKELKDLTGLEISGTNAIIKADAIIQIESSTKKSIQDKIDALSNDAKTKSLAQDFSNLDSVIKEYTSYSVNLAKHAYLKDITDKLYAVLQKLTVHIQTTIQTTFDTISVDVVDFYNILENSHLFLKNPKLLLTTGKDRAVELEIEFATEKINPAFKFMSESQVNSFGLSIFLAAVKHFNSSFKFFILDDVINSFDAFKRTRVAQLLASKFSDFQVLVLTHDQIFFDTMQRDFPQWQRYKVTSWDYTTGPKFKLSKAYAEEIKEFLDNDEPVNAGQKLGRYLEWIFGLMNESLQTPIRYKIENTYTLNEFYEPLVSRCKSKLKQPNKKHKVVTAFETFEQGTIFRNYCAHWKNEQTQFTTDEIQGIFDKWMEIEGMLYCTNCKSFASYNNSTGAEYVKCNCGTLDLLDNSFFV